MSKDIEKMGNLYKKENKALLLKIFDPRTVLPTSLTN